MTTTKAADRCRRTDSSERGEAEQSVILLTLGVLFISVVIVTILVVKIYDWLGSLTP